MKKSPNNTPVKKITTSKKKVAHKPRKYHLNHRDPMVDSLSAKPFSFDLDLAGRIKHRANFKGLLPWNRS